ncbi:hypothetical protein C8A00DRAFT_28848 [Chaetomidium leptoderma]|uniref:Uncharacterized protein n=1 Tax=Chaetomidium leptoderma TaxID=669021 RepID=A0AAN7A116_9PEZI|nr:hypothetical protein C8A00DRAFT_28848 [Chaetomidium leptoderma]
MSRGVPHLESSLEPPSTDSSRDGATTTAGGQEKRQPPDTRSGKKGGRPSWLTNKAQKLASWLATSEPSAQALTQHRKESFQRAGVAQNDTEPHSKLQAPIGEIPSDAIRPSTGPSPEELVVQKKKKKKKGEEEAAAAERRKKRKKQQQHPGHPKGVVLLPGQGGGPTSSSSESWSSIYSGQEGSVSDSLSAFPYAGSSN